MTNIIETKPLVTKEEITLRAYLLWEKAGRPVGRDVEFWAQAEQQLMTIRASAAKEPLKATAKESVKEVKAAAPTAILPATSRGTTTVVAATKPAKVKTSLPKTRKKSARF